MPATPTATFVDIAAAAGVNARHDNGARGKKLMPETMSGGGGFIDYNRDGRLDVLLVAGGDVEHPARGTT
ncbi:MAG: CRTAC1 family protein, partial [Chloroflexota bacterium]